MGSAMSAGKDHEANKQTASMIEADSQYNAIQRRKQAAQLMGEQIAAFGANNIEVSGSAEAMIKSDQIDAEIEAMNIVYTGKFQAKDLVKRSQNQKNNAYMGLATQAAMAYMTGGTSLFASAAASGGGTGKGYYSENSSGSKSGNIS